MVPDPRMVQGEIGGDSGTATFAPDRSIPVRLAQLSALLAVVCGLAAAFAVQDSGQRIAFWFACGVQSLIFLFALSAVIRRASLRFTLTAQRLEIERGLIARRRESLDLFRVRDVVLEQGFIQRLRGLGTITLYSTDQVEPTLAIPSIPRAQPVYERLRDACSRARQQRVVQIDG